MKRGLSRRNLFKYMGMGGATALAASCEQKPEKLIPLLLPPNEFEYTPQTAYQYMTTCQECSAGCGMMVTTREGRAQKAEGNPNHPVNRGALCAKGQASMQALYNPERLAFPQQDGAPLSWTDAIKSFSEQIQGAAGQVVYLGKPIMGSDGPFIEQWLNAVGGGKRISFEVQSQISERAANQIAFGRADLPQYALEKARYLLNFSADFMETWGSVVKNTRQFTAMHAYQNGRKNKFVHVGPHVSLTGAKADEWVMIKPGTEGLMALAIAHEIRESKGHYQFLKKFLAEFSAEKVADEIGITAGTIKRISQEFESHLPSLALGGGNLVATEQGTATLVAINILNAVAGNMGETIQFHDQTPPVVNSHKDILQLIQDLNEEKIKLLIIENVNPVYALPPSFGFAEAMQNAFVVSLSTFRDETTNKAQLLLPTLTPYESWGDTFLRSGIRSVMQPVMSPVDKFDAKAKADILLEVSKQLGTGQFAGVSTYLDYLKKIWTGIHAETDNSLPFSAFWIKTLETGGVFDNGIPVNVSLQPDVVNYKPKTPQLEGKGLVLLPSSSLLMGDGSGANKPWLQEIPNPMTQIVWDSWVEINPDTAKKLGIKDREVVRVSTPHGSVEATAYYHFGIHREAIAIPLGQGHVHSGPVADNYGVNVLDLLPMTTDPNSGNLSWISVNAEVSPTSQRSYTVNVDGNARQLGRSISLATTVEAIKNPQSHEDGQHQRPREVYPPRRETAGYYKPYRWGMTIDLDRCNGCSACVVACYAENNLPVVGKERTGLGREMSWIRIDRYIEGHGDDFETRFAPITCQQCENAGCEPVCPVYATYHNSEGLNVQAYNRCVGTRYCSNNCAYKVRRFNWFNYEFPKPLNQQLNTTITTRGVGVMEKCTFCVQRIKESQNAARQLGRDVQDGEILTACQQTCPTQAIKFGNLMDSESEVSRSAKRTTSGNGDNSIKNRDRQYEMIAELNYKPAITYLKKVNLDDPSSSHHNEKSQS